jgi:predicted phosphodiesterase
LTRLAILSDIHGNLPALEAVIEDMQQFSPDHVIVAGDLINIVPFDAEVMQRVVSLGWTAIRGNHEFYLLNYGTSRESEGMRRSPSPAWLNKNLKDWFAYIAAMPDELTLYYPDGPAIYVTHGIPGDPFDAIMRVTREEKILRWFENVQPTTVVTAHYHLSVDRHVGRWHFMNPGPVGAVMDGTHDACYLLLDAIGDHWQATFRRVPYDFALVEAAFEHHRLDEILGVEGLLKCEQLRRARPTINAFSRWLDACYPGEDWSFERAYEFLALPLEAVWDHIGEGYLVNTDLPLPPAPVPRR